MSTDTQSLHTEARCVTSTPKRVRKLGSAPQPSHVIFSEEQRHGGSRSRARSHNNVDATIEEEERHGSRLSDVVHSFKENTKFWIGGHRKKSKPESPTSTSRVFQCFPAFHHENSDSESSDVFQENGDDAWDNLDETLEQTLALATSQAESVVLKESKSADVMMKQSASFASFTALSHSEGATTERVRKISKDTSAVIASNKAVTSPSKEPPTVDWAVVQRAVISVLSGRHLRDGQLADLHLRMRRLLISRVGPLLFDSLRRQTLRKGMSALRKKLMLLDGDDLIAEFADTWNTFFMHSSTTVQAILFLIKPRQLTVRQAILVAFRDEVVLPMEFRLSFALNRLVPGSQHVPAIQQMLLVLQNVIDSYPPAEPRLRVERLTAQVVRPFLGFNGIYDGESKPIIRSNVSESDLLAKRRCSATIEQSKLLRPLSVLSGRVENLHDLFVRSAARKVSTGKHKSNGHVT